jgi:hypothetical protein
MPPDHSRARRESPASSTALRRAEHIGFEARRQCLSATSRDQPSAGLKGTSAPCFQTALREDAASASRGLLAYRPFRARPGRAARSRPARDRRQVGAKPTREMLTSRRTGQRSRINDCYIDRPRPGPVHAHFDSGRKPDKECSEGNGRSPTMVVNWTGMLPFKTGDNSQLVNLLPLEETTPRRRRLLYR